MWDPVPWPGIEPGPPALVAQSLSHWTTREVPIYFYILHNTVVFQCTDILYFMTFRWLQFKILYKHEKLSDIPSPFSVVKLVTND